MSKKFFFSFYGALTSKPYAFTARPWELRSALSIDFCDGVGSNLRLDFKESEIVRILPRKNPAINEDWISDKARFFYDAFKRQRVKNPYLQKDGSLVRTKWSTLLSSLTSVLKVYSYEYGNSSIGVFSSPSLDSESFLSARVFANNFGFSFFHQGCGKGFNLDNPFFYRSNVQIQDLEKSDFCLFVGTNPRNEASTLNLRFRKIFKRGTCEFASVGANFSPTYPLQSCGLTSSTLVAIAEGKHKICKKLIQSKNPILVLGSNLFKRDDKNGISQLIQTILLSIKKEKSFFILHSDVNSVGACEIGFSTLSVEKKKRLKVAFCLNSLKEFSPFSFLPPLLVLQDSHGNSRTKEANFVLPSPTYVEKNGLFYNTEGRPQKSALVFQPPGLVREDWKIFSALSVGLKKALPFSSFTSLSLSLNKSLPSSSFHLFTIDKEKKELTVSYSLPKSAKIVKSAFNLELENFYMVPQICESSQTLAHASEILRVSSTNFRI